MLGSEALSQPHSATESDPAKSCVGSNDAAHFHFSPTTLDARPLIYLSSRSLVAGRIHARSRLLVNKSDIVVPEAHYTHAVATLSTQPHDTSLRRPTSQWPTTGSKRRNASRSRRRA
jgi:hypothetical protein